MATTKRSPYDFYATPLWCVNAILDRVSLGRTILEPCAGNGIIIDAIKTRGDYRVDANEIDEAHLAALQCSKANNITICNYLATERDDLVHYDTIITNPPFSIAQEILEHTFQTMQTNTQVIMLLRLNFLGSQKRYEFWQKYPPDSIYVLSKRPSFTGGGTDSQEYAWFVWNPKTAMPAINVI